MGERREHATGEHVTDQFASWCRSHDLAPVGVKSLKSREPGKSRKKKRSKRLKWQQPERKEKHRNG